MARAGHWTRPGVNREPAAKAGGGCLRRTPLPPRQSRLQVCRTTRLTCAASMAATRKLDSVSATSRMCVALGIALVAVSRAHIAQWHSSHTTRTVEVGHRRDVVEVLVGAHHGWGLWGAARAVRAALARQGRRQTEDALHHHARDHLVVWRATGTLGYNSLLDLKILPRAPVGDSASAARVRLRDTDT
jgi:hypothetical protein